VLMIAVPSELAGTAVIARIGLKQTCTSTLFEYFEAHLLGSNVYSIFAMYVFLNNMHFVAKQSLEKGAMFAQPDPRA
jgi:hypothetical protein